jgi:hypothetical protein
LLTAVALQLSAKMNGTTNMGSNTATVTNGTIWIPSAAGWITLDSTRGTKFRASIVQSGTNLITTVTGSGPNQNIQAAIQLQYQQAQRAGAIFDFGIASAGEIVTSAPLTVTGATDPTKGSVLVATFQLRCIQQLGQQQLDLRRPVLHQCRGLEQLRLGDRGQLSVE